MIKRLRENWRKNPDLVLAMLLMMLLSVMDLVTRHRYLPVGAAEGIVEWLVLGLAGCFFYKFIVRISQPR